ncbi:MAG: hypothetical protein KDI66_21780 [Xanthomonadales bacterium]|nr:hypothetical protein [Xanthomonadales bacterium]
MGFRRFYTTELAVVLFWLFAFFAIVGMAVTAAASPSLAYSTIIGGCLAILFVRVLLEVMAVLFQIHARLDELCEHSRRTDAAARAEQDKARIAANLAAKTLNQ